MECMGCNPVLDFLVYSYGTSGPKAVCRLPINRPGLVNRGGPVRPSVKTPVKNLSDTSFSTAVF